MGKNEGRTPKSRSALPRVWNTESCSNTVLLIVRYGQRGSSRKGLDLICTSRFMSERVSKTSLPEALKELSQRNSGSAQFFK